MRCKFFMVWTICTIVYVLFFFVYQPKVDLYGVGELKFNKDKLCYEMCIDGDIYEVANVKDVYKVPVHEGMLVYYLRLAGDRDIVYSAQKRSAEEWAKVEHRDRWGAGLFGALLLFGLFFRLENYIRFSRSKRVTQCN